MPIPSQLITIRDPGLGVVSPATSVPLVMGVASASRADEIASVNSISDLASGWGNGPLVQDGARILSESGGPILVCQIAGDVAGTSGAVTKSPAGTSTGTITLAGEPFDTFDGRLEITKSGTNGTAKFRYSLDAQTIDTTIEPTFSPELTVPSAGTYLIPNSNITVTFVPGGGAVFFEKGDVHTWASVEPYFSGTELADAFAAVLGSFRQWRFAHVAGNAPTSSAAATIAAALATHMDTAQGKFRYARAFIDAGSKDTFANLASAFASYENRRVGPAYGQIVRTALKPFVGFSHPRRSMLAEKSARAASNLISTSLHRVASGGLAGILAIEHDEYQSPGVDDLRISSVRTWPGRPGFYLTRGRLASPPGSDFQYTHNGFVMDVACAAVVRAQQAWIGKSFRTTNAGTLDPLDAEDLRQDVLKQLRAQLTEPMNAEGKRGHVSALDYRVDLTNNVLISGQILTEVAIRPRGYADFFVTQIGFAIDVPEAA
jgi:hypothetical protein